MASQITIETSVVKDIESVWNFWNTPEHIKGWMHASSDWQCLEAVVDLQVDGRFSLTLAQKGNSFSFKITGTYTDVRKPSFLAFTIDGGRKVTVSFLQTAECVHITETFEMEDETSAELQRSGWQSILNAFKDYAESQE